MIIVLAVETIVFITCIIIGQVKGYWKLIRREIERELENYLWDKEMSELSDAMRKKCASCSSWIF